MEASYRSRNQSNECNRTISLFLSLSLSLSLSLFFFLALLRCFSFKKKKDWYVSICFTLIDRGIDSSILGRGRRDEAARGALNMVNERRDSCREVQFPSFFFTFFFPLPFYTRNVAAKRIHQLADIHSVNIFLEHL